MGALSPTTAKAIAGAASAAKSSGVSSASKSAGSAKDVGPPKQVTPKVESKTTGTGAVSKASSSASKASTSTPDVYSSQPSSSKKSTAKSSVAKAGSSGGTAAKAPTTKTVQTTYVPGFTADTLDETRKEQATAMQIAALENAAREAMLNPASALPLVGAIGGGVDGIVDLAQNIASPTSTLNSPALQQRIAENGGVAPFEGVVDWAGIANAIMPKQEPVDITVRGGNAYDKVSDQPLSWGNMLDLLGTPEVSSQYLSSGTPDRLPAEPVIRTAALPPYTPDSAYVGRTIDPNGDYSAPLGAIAAADVGSLPASERWGWKSPYAGMATTILQALGNDPKLPFVPDVPAPKGLDAAVEPPSTWDNVVDNTGKLLSHTGLGGIVSTLFPDMWGGIGNAMKNIGNVQTKYPDEMAVALDDIYGERSQMLRDQAAKPKFPDLNHNGIDDRVEGYTGPDTKPKPGKTPPPGTTLPPRSDDIPLPVFDLPPTRTAQFPVMPPYDPGRSPEFMYFLNNHLADGGMVEAPAYAEGGSIDQSDPRVQLIGATEDVLEKIKGGAKPDERDAEVLKAFVAQFGDAALKSLNDNVGEGLSMKASGKGRMIKGPGGPKDDAVPAVIVEEGSVVSPAKLSNGEFVFPVEAVEGAGGPEALQELADRFAAARKPTMQTADASAVMEDILTRYSQGKLSAADTQKALKPLGYKANLRPRYGNEVELEPLKDGPYITVTI